jgi:two-component SAPR family response regulator
MRFIFISGYASEAAVDGNGLQPGDIRLMKPVSRKELLSAVHKRLACR